MTQHNCGRILIVDDEHNILLSLQRLFEKAGYSVSVADGGQAGIAEFQRHPDITLAIVDSWMPEVSGVDVLRKMVEVRPAVPRMVLTGTTDAGELVEYINTGLASRVLFKPWDRAIMVQTARELINCYTADRERAILNARIEEQQLEIEELRRLLGKNKQGDPQPAVTTDETVQDLIALLAFVLDSSGDGSGQSQRVAELSSSLAVSKGLSANEVRQIETAALLQNIADIAVPRDTAMNPEDDTADLDPAVRPMIAGEILKRISGFEEISDMVRRLQEARAGIESTDNLSQPLGSQILYLTDQFDRELYPDRKPTNIRPASAIKAIQDSAGEKFDEDLVKLFRGEVLPSMAAQEDQSIEIKASDLQPGMVLARDVHNLHGVSLLTAGTVLDKASIHKLKKNAHLSPYFSRTFIKLSSVPVGENEGDLHKELTRGKTDIPAGELAAAKVKASRPEPEVEKLPLEPDPSKPLIVVIDDDHNVLRALRRELSHTYHVVGFHNPAKALQYVKNTDEVFAVISDYMMPGMLGTRLLQQIQESKPALPCLVMTAHATRDTITRLAKSAQLVRVIPKPWDKEHLLLTLKKLHED